MNAAVTTSPKHDRAYFDAWLDYYVEMWNGHDPDALAALYTVDAPYFDPCHPGYIHGREEIRGFLSGFFVAIPDIEFHPDHPIVFSDDGSYAVSSWTCTGQMLGDWPALGLAGTGGKMSLEGISRWDFDGDLVHRYATFYDSLDAVRQLGGLPSAGGLLDRAFRPMQRLVARGQRRVNARRRSS
jgi:steroid delta-isomerase-like uncharacterized protein